MNQFPHKDQDLTRFLQQHSPQAPPASPDLEDRILEAIQSTEQTTTKVVPFHSQLNRTASSQRSRHGVWLVPTGIAASLIAGFVSYRLLLPPQPSATELASLEDFIENNWQNTVNSNSDGEFPIVDPVVN